MPSVDRVLALALGLLLLLAPRAQAEELLVFAAASLTDVLEELARGFESATGHRVLFNFAGSNDLARQIRAGAPADVFLSADVSQMDAVERDGLVRAGERVALLSNALVVVVPAHAAAAPASPAELVAVRRLALADPQAVPAGVYARRWLEARGLWPALRERVVPALNVRAALAAVETETADAGIVYRTDAALSSRVRVAFAVPRDEGPAIVYVLAPLATSRQAATATLVRFLTSAAARAVYERHGFVVLAP
jgi:molybdate transport system substrate-binding protein